LKTGPPRRATATGVSQITSRGHLRYVHLIVTVTLKQYLEILAQKVEIYASKIDIDYRDGH